MPEYYIFIIEHNLHYFCLSFLLFSFLHIIRITIKIKFIYVMYSCDRFLTYFMGPEDSGESI